MSRRREIRRLGFCPLLLAVLCLFAADSQAAPIQPTEIEQYLLELINRARANPTGEAARYGIDLNEAPPGVNLNISPAPKQPMAFNFYLNDATDKHGQWMLDNDLFQHAGEGGSQPSQRGAAAGYSLGTTWAYGENLGWKGNTGSAPDVWDYVDQLHEGLFVDTPIADRGHRVNMLKESYKEAGISVLTGLFAEGGRNYQSVMLTNDFAFTGTQSFLTGVVFDDFDGTQFYSPIGEGLSDIRVLARSTTTGQLFQTTTFATGGYTLPLSSGTYDVFFSGGDLPTTAFTGIPIGAQNVKLDVIAGNQHWNWWNVFDPFDVDSSGVTELADLLPLIDDLNRHGTRSLVAPPASRPSLFVDVSRNNVFDLEDVLLVVDALNRTSPVGLTSQGVLASFESSSPALVPEPSTVALLAAGLLGLLRCRLRRYSVSSG
jgi:hypothetical protein